ncbi:sortase [Candidatus Microgenomates bacterium]|nr:sortase [Candidatus Microgenomates bacterium]
MKTLANTSLATGAMLLLYSSALVVQHYNPARLHFWGMNSVAIQAEFNIRPERIVIKRIGIDVPVVSVPSFENRWEISPEGASYLETSPLPGTQGNSIIYGHNWSSIFQHLTNVKPGDFIEVYMSDKTRRVFGVTATQTVDPSATEVLKPASDRHLTLYTCTGFLDTKRFVVSATLQSQIASN